MRHYTAPAMARRQTLWSLSPARAVAVAAVLGGGLALAPQALAVTAPGPLSSDPANPSFSSTRTYTWGPATADDPANSVVYEGGFNGAADPVSSPWGPVAGSGTFGVRAVEVAPDGTRVDESGFVTIDVDTATITGSRSPGPNPRGWNDEPVGVFFTCEFTVFCTPSTTLNEGVYPDVIGTGQVASGEERSISLGPVRVDLTPPSPGLPNTPRDGEVAGTTSVTFTWTPGADPLSGIQYYEVWRVGGGRIASAPARSNQVTASVPAGTLSWFVRTFDNAYTTGSTAQNAADSPTYTLTVDPSAPPAPGGLEGPGPATTDTTPTFTWTGAGPRFEWSVTPAGDSAPVRQGATEEKQVKVTPALPDGAYVFGVKQVRPGGQPGAEATHRFTVDTVAPPAPTITSRPPASTALVSPPFAWQGEPGGTYLWRMVTEGGTVERGPIAVNATSVGAGPVGPGTYLFQVRQRDAAGNLGPWSGPERVTVTVAGGSSSSGVKLTPPKSGRPRPVILYPRRLKPRAGVRIPTLRPVLQWRRGPRFTMLYNVQVFEIRGRRVVKVKSAFSRNTQWRVPPRTLKKGKRYAWRVWPYRGLRGYTKKPLGISYFDVATKLKQPKSRAARR